MRHLLLRPAAVFLLLAGTSIALPAQQATPAAPPAARAEDVASMDAIIAALYDVISGGIGQERDWDRMRSLFAPGARLIPVGRRADGTGAMRMLSVEDYIDMSGPYLVRTGFRERELARTTDRFGDVAHVFSSYEGVMESDSSRIRGINSIQLHHDGTRWWVVTVFWQAERPDLTLPPEYRGQR